MPKPKACYWWLWSIVQRSYGAKFSAHPSPFWGPWSWIHFQLIHRLGSGEGKPNLLWQPVSIFQHETRPASDFLWVCGNEDYYNQNNKPRKPLGVDTEFSPQPNLTHLWAKLQPWAFKKIFLTFFASSPYIAWIQRKRAVPVPTYTLQQMPLVPTLATGFSDSKDHVF